MGSNVTKNIELLNQMWCQDTRVAIWSFVFIILPSMQFPSSYWENVLKFSSSNKITCFQKSLHLGYINTKCKDDIKLTKWVIISIIIAVQIQKRYGLVCCLQVSGKLMFSGGIQKEQLVRWLCPIPLHPRKASLMHTCLTDKSQQQISRLSLNYTGLPVDIQLVQKTVQYGWRKTHAGLSIDRGHLPVLKHVNHLMANYSEASQSRTESHTSLHWNSPCRLDPHCPPSLYPSTQPPGSHLIWVNEQQNRLCRQGFGKWEADIHH